MSNTEPKSYITPSLGQVRVAPFSRKANRLALPPIGNLHMGIAPQRFGLRKTGRAAPFAKTLSKVSKCEPPEDAGRPYQMGANSLPGKPQAVGNPKTK